MDFVLGNPPYIRVHNLGNTFREAKKFSFAQNGMTDIFIVFYEIGIRMLTDSGILGYITPSSFYNSLAGSYMRHYFVKNNLIDKIVNLQHYQAFSTTTYTTLVILRKNRTSKNIDYYRFDEKNRIPYFVDTLAPSDYFINDCFYFSYKNDLHFLKQILCSKQHQEIVVKNGYATLCDEVYITSFDFESQYIIPVIKASRGNEEKILFPYNTDGELVLEIELKKDKNIFDYLLKNKSKLLMRSNINNDENNWYAFGRSQAIKDTFKNKIAINTMIRDIEDLKIISAPCGTGVYSGLYIIVNNIPFDKVEEALLCNEFLSYVILLGKYKNNGYYTYSSKDIKFYLNYKLMLGERENDK